MILLFVGMVEMIISAQWTRSVSEGRRWKSCLITLFNILIWYYVLRTVIEDLHNWKVVALYAIGCAIGTFIGTTRRK
jgi:uncharacterized protein YebE (UPF0316 family)